MNSRDLASLLDIIKAAELSQSFIKNIDQLEFNQDVKTQSAVLYQIAILGEAVKRLSPELRHRHPDIPWSAMAGMRDKLVHDYEGVDIDRVWLTLELYIPELLEKVKTLLQ